MAKQSDVSSRRELMEEAMELHGETFADLDSCTLTEEEMQQEFDLGYMPIGGILFTAWTASRVYFLACACYDGSLYVDSVLRHPGCGIVDRIASN